jgi:hypothetical protein
MMLYMVITLTWPPVETCWKLCRRVSCEYTIILCGPGSSVGIETGYGLDGPGIESRWGARFFAHFQTSPEAHPASCTMGTGSFPGGKAAGAWC